MQTHHARVPANSRSEGRGMAPMAGSGHASTHQHYWRCRSPGFGKKWWGEAIGQHSMPH